VARVLRLNHENNKICLQFYLFFSGSAGFPYLKMRDFKVSNGKSGDRWISAREANYL
jgi:hypothetical protein